MSKHQSKIDLLIQELCPNGVPFRELGNLGYFYGGLTGKSKDDFSEGNAKYITYMNVYSNIAVNVDSTELVKVFENENQNKVKYGDILFTGSSETPDECGMSSVLTTKISEPIYLNSFCFGLRLNDMALFNPEFLKHLFRDTSVREQIAQTASGVTRFNVSKKRFAKIRIPIPPLKIQEEIVKILNKFTELEVELEAELEARQRQYDHYRDELLGCKGVPTKRLGDIVVVTDYVANGSFAALRKNVVYKKAPDFAVLLRTVDLAGGLDASKFIYIDENAYNFLAKSQLSGGELIINNVGAGVGTTFLCPNLEAKMSLAPNAVVLRTKNNKFYFHWFKSKFGKAAISNIVSNSAMPKFNKTSLRNLQIPVLEPREQDRIVSILDKFEALVNDISTGLPAEINARRQQYEYYRNMLLTFKEYVG